MNTVVHHTSRGAVRRRRNDARPRRSPIGNRRRNTAMPRVLELLKEPCFANRHSRKDPKALASERDTKEWRIRNGSYEP